MKSFDSVLESLSHSPEVTFRLAREWVEQVKQLESDLDDDPFWDDMALTLVKVAQMVGNVISCGADTPQLTQLHLRGVFLAIRQMYLDDVLRLETNENRPELTQRMRALFENIDCF